MRRKTSRLNGVFVEPNDYSLFVFRYDSVRGIGTKSLFESQKENTTTTPIIRSIPSNRKNTMKQSNFAVNWVKEKEETYGIQWREEGQGEEADRRLVTQGHRQKMFHLSVVQERNQHTPLLRYDHTRHLVHPRIARSGVQEERRQNASTTACGDGGKARRHDASVVSHRRVHSPRRHTMNTQKRVDEKHHVLELIR